MHVFNNLAKKIFSFQRSFCIKINYKRNCSYVFDCFLRPMGNVCLKTFLKASRNLLIKVQIDVSNNQQSFKQTIRLASVHFITISGWIKSPLTPYSHKISRALIVLSSPNWQHLNLLILPEKSQ